MCCCCCCCCCIAAAALLGGCRGAAAFAGRRLDTADFIANGAGAAAAAADPAVVARRAAGPLHNAVGGDVVLLAGPPPESVVASPVTASGSIDALVGQINGRPLYASDFFATRENRLSAEAPVMTDLELRKYLFGSLIADVQDRLVLADFESTVPVAQRQRILAYVESIRSSLVSERGGSVVLAEKQLGQEGTTLRKEVQERRDEAFIGQRIRQVVMPKARVSQRDVELRYARDIEQYTKPDTAVLRVLVIDDDSEARAAVEADLAEKTFAETAAAHTRMFRSAGGLVDEKELSVEGYKATEFFGIQEWQRAASGLEVGDRVGPVRWRASRGPRLVWIELEEIRRNSMSLYQAQESIRKQIVTERFKAAQSEYLMGLMERGVLSNAEEMLERLFRIARERYPAVSEGAPPGPMGAGASSAAAGGR